MGEALLAVRKTPAGLAVAMIVLYFTSVYWVSLVFQSWSYKDKQRLKWVSAGQGREAREQLDGRRGQEF